MYAYDDQKQSANLDGNILLFEISLCLVLPAVEFHLDPATSSGCS